MPNFYERVTAIPDSLPAQLSGPRVRRLRLQVGRDLQRE